MKDCGAECIVFGIRGCGVHKSHKLIARFVVQGGEKWIHFQNMRNQTPEDDIEKNGEFVEMKTDLELLEDRIFLRIATIETDLWKLFVGVLFFSFLTNIMLFYILENIMKSVDVAGVRMNYLRYDLAGIHDSLLNTWGSDEWE